MRIMRIVGIDVSAKSLDVCLQTPQGKRLAVFSNDQAGFKKLAKFIVSGTTPVQICMEATGTYHFDAAVYLDHKKYIQVMVINPRIARKFAESLNRQDKTDSVDACVLAEYCARMEFVLWQKPRDEYIKLRGF